MNISVSRSSINENALIWAIIASILLHILFAVVIPNIKFEIKKETKQVLKIELQKPLPPAPDIAPPLPIAEPEPPKPIKPKVKPKPIKPIAKEPEVTEPPEATPPVTDLIAVKPSVENTPKVIVPVAPPAPIEPPPPPSKADIDQYRDTLGRAIAKYKSYPKIAQRRGWQGSILLDLKIDENGNVLSATVRKSSGHKSLDKRALEMVKKASPFPLPPVALQGNSFNITVPIAFKLKNS